MGKDVFKRAVKASLRFHCGALPQVTPDVNAVAATKRMRLDVTMERRDIRRLYRRCLHNPVGSYSQLRLLGGEAGPGFACARLRTKQGSGEPHLTHLQTTRHSLCLSSITTAIHDGWTYGLLHGATSRYYLYTRTAVTVEVGLSQYKSKSCLCHGDLPLSHQKIAAHMLHSPKQKIRGSS